MAFEIGGALRPLFFAWIVSWPSQAFAGPPQQKEAPKPEHFAEEIADVPEAYRARLVPLALGRLTLSKRGLEYRTAFMLKRGELPFRVWGGRTRKQPALGIDFEPTLRRQKVRFGAYGTPDEVGVAIRLRY